MLHKLLLGNIVLWILNSKFIILLIIMSISYNHSAFIIPYITSPFSLLRVSEICSSIIRVKVFSILTLKSISARKMIYFVGWFLAPFNDSFKFLHPFYHFPISHNLLIFWTLRSINFINSIGFQICEIFIIFCTSSSKFSSIILPVIHYLGFSVDPIK